MFLSYVSYKEEELCNVQFALTKKKKHPSKMQLLLKEINCSCTVGTISFFKVLTRIDNERKKKK